MAAPITPDGQPTSGQPTSGQASVARRTVPRAARRVGYLLGVAVNLALVWLVNGDPGWRWVAILTDDFGRVVGLVTASLVVGAVLNLVYVVGDPAWLKRLGDAVTAGFAGVILLRLLVIFPFELSSWSPGWVSALRFGLGLLAVVMGIAVIANAVQSLQEAIGLGSPSPADGPDDS